MLCCYFLKWHQLHLLAHQFVSLYSKICSNLSIFLVFYFCGSRGLESSNFRNHEWSDLLFAIPGSIELRPPEVSGELDPIPTSALLHGWFCASDLSRITAVPVAYCPRTDTANVGCQEYDVRSWSKTWPIPHSISLVQRQNEHQRSWWTGVECAEQKLFLLRRMDSQQCEV